MSTKRNKPPEMQVDYRMTLSERATMLAGCVRLPAVFIRVREYLKSDFFGAEDEMLLKAFWTTILYSHAEHGVEALTGNPMAAESVVRLSCQRLAETQPQAVPAVIASQLLDPAAGFIQQVYRAPLDVFPHDVISRLVVRFLQERGVQDRVRGLMLQSDGLSVTNFNEMLDGARHDAQRFSSLSHDPVRAVAPDNYRPTLPPVKSTGVPFLDQMIGGGHHAGATYGVLGAYGSGKTALAIQLAAAVSGQEVRLAAEDSAHQLGHVYYFHYEMSEEEIRGRFWSHVGFVDYKRIRDWANGAELSDHANIASADLPLLAAAGAGPLVNLSERRRIEYAQNRINKNLWQIDCAGVAGSAHEFGTGYLNDVAGVLHRQRDEYGRRCAAVIIDYAGACVERHTSDKDRQYQLLSQFARNSADLLAKPFECPVWVMHQLKGAANARSPGQRMHHSDAAGSTRFGENFYYCLNLGTVNAKFSARQLTNSKARESQQQESNVILRMAGGYNRLVDVSNQMMFDRGGKLVNRTTVGPAANQGGHTTDGTETDPFAI